MSDVVAFSVPALTVSLALGRPRVGLFRIHHSIAAIIGATLTVALHLIPIERSLLDHSALHALV